MKLRRCCGRPPSLIDGWLRVDAAKVLGRKFDTLGLFRA